MAKRKLELLRGFLPANKHNAWLAGFLIIGILISALFIRQPERAVTAAYTESSSTPTTPAISTQVPTSVPVEIEFQEVSIKPDNSWLPPLYPAPLALNKHDHFYFIRPLLVDSGNMPLPDYRYGYIFPGKTAVHTGVDIVSQIRRPVLAAGDGKVIFSGYGLLNGAGDETDPYGLAVMIRHSFSFDGYLIYTVYAHLDRIEVKTGDWVTSGEEIGLIGTTGMTTGPHVHFEVRIENTAGDKIQNPELWLIPPVGYGVLAGRIENNFGTLMTTKELWLKSLATGKVSTIFTYSPKTKQVDDYYRENFVIGDLPAGEYELTTWYNYKLHKATVRISPGAVNFVQFFGNNGFFQANPPPPAIEDFLP
jgi:murein DD-endopeptidase MepM/ murein hydrolase activator NlpD